MARTTTKTYFIWAFAIAGMAWAAAKVYELVTKKKLTKWL